MNNSDENGEQDEADRQKGDVVVVRLQWSSRFYSHVFSESLVRDYLLTYGYPYPRPSSILTIKLFDAIPIDFTVISTHEPFQSPHKKIDKNALTVYILPHIPNYLTCSSITETRSTNSLLSYLLNSHPDDRVPFATPKVILLKSSYDVPDSAAKQLAQVVDHDKRTLVYISAMQLLSQSTSRQALLSKLKLYIEACEYCVHPCVVVLDNVQFLFPRDDVHGFSVIVPPFTDFVHSLEHDLKVVLVSCEPLSETTYSCMDIMFELPSSSPSLGEEKTSGSDNDAKGEGVERTDYEAMEKRWNSISTELPGNDNVLRLLRRIFGPFGTMSVGSLRARIAPPRGALVYGVPGTGKTKLVAAACKACALRVRAVHVNEIVDGELGESERRLKTVFSDSDALRDVIVFDEMESLFMRRSASDVRLINMLCKCMDETPAVRIVAITNKPWLIQRQLLGHGRLEVVAQARVPAPSDRVSIARSLCAQYRLREQDAAAVERAVVGAEYSGWTGADVGGICRRTVLAYLGGRSGNGDGGVEGKEGRGIEKVCIEKVLRSCYRSVSDAEIHRVDWWTNND